MILSLCIFEHPKAAEILYFTNRKINPSSITILMTSVYNTFSSLWFSEMLPLILWFAWHWQQQKPVLRLLFGSRNLTFQSHGVSLFQQKSMQMKGTLGGEKAEMHLEIVRHETGTVKYGLHNI